MTYKLIDFETGPDGAALTNSNSGATYVYPGSGNTATFDAASKVVGSFGARFVAANTAPCQARWDASAPNAKMAFTHMFRYNGSAPSNGGKAIQIDSDVGTMLHAYVYADALRIAKSNGSNLGTYAGGGSSDPQSIWDHAFTPGTYYRLAFVIDATAKTLVANLYSGLSATPLNATPLSVTACDFGSAVSVVGANTYVESGADLSIDAMQFDDGATVEIGPPHSSASTVRPSGVASNPGAWTNVGGAASLAAAVADELDTTYAETPDAPSGAAITFSNPGLSSGNVTVKVRHSQKGSTPTVTRKYDLMQGSSVIATKSYTLTDSVVAEAFTTTSTQAGNITDYGTLLLRVTDTTA